MVLPNTVLRSAITVADHIRRAVMTKEPMKRSTGDHLGRVTVSVGVATLRPGDSMVTLIERADACLYAAERSGRNRVISETHPEMIQEQRLHVAWAAAAMRGACWINQSRDGRAGPRCGK